MSRKPPKPLRARIVRNRALREKVRERDQGICAKCGIYDAKWIHDHIVELWQGGADTLENSQTLCRRHSDEKTFGNFAARAKTDRLAARAELTKQRRAIR